MDGSVSSFNLQGAIDDSTAIGDRESIVEVAVGDAVSELGYAAFSQC